MPIDAFDNSTFLTAHSYAPYLKLTGIAIQLGETMESRQQPSEAYNIYVDALDIIQGAHERRSLSPAERLRLAQLAFKLGSLAKECQKPSADQEKYLVIAVEEILKLVKDAQPADTPLSLAEKDLPLYVRKVDIIAPMQELGEFYRRTGNIEYVEAPEPSLCKLT